LDIAIAGDGWMQVITPAGEEILSRRGDLRIDPNGNLVDAEQNQILGDGGPINVPADSQVTIGADGTVSFIPRGETALGTVVTGRILLVNPDPETLTKGLDGNIRAEGQANLEPAADVQLAVGALETSNVNPIASMVQMIELSRSFEGHIQTMKSADELDASSASLMRLE
jgi:flagellar basal-body rod protein FlgF